MSGFYYAMAVLGSIALLYTIGRHALVPARVISPVERVISVALMSGGVALDLYAAFHL